jgi:hypothetical protein
MSTGRSKLQHGQVHSLANAAPSARAEIVQSLPSGHIMEKVAEIRRVAMERSASDKGRARSSGSKYLNEAREISRVKLHRLSRAISNAEPAAALTAPRKVRAKVGPRSSVPSEKATETIALSFFHLWSSRIASSGEESIVLLLSQSLGVQEALAIAGDFNWKLSARFYAALTRVSPPPSNSATVQARSAIPAAIAGVHRKVK